MDALDNLRHRACMRVLGCKAIFTGGHLTALVCTACTEKALPNVSLHATNYREGCVRKQNSSLFKRQFARKQNCINQHVRERRCAMQTAVSQTRC